MQLHEALPGNPGVSGLPLRHGEPYAFEVTNAFGERELIFADLATPDDLAQPHVPLYA